MRPKDILWALAYQRYSRAEPERTFEDPSSLYCSARTVNQTGIVGKRNAAVFGSAPPGEFEISNFGSSGAAATS